MLSGPALQQRLHSLATARLRRLGAGWDGPRAVRALGAGVHEAQSQAMPGSQSTGSPMSP